MLVLTCLAFAALSFDGCSYNVCVLLTYALSLSKMAEKIIAEDEGIAMLREEANL
jgi:hypothetical protein